MAWSEWSDCRKVAGVWLKIRETRLSCYESWGLLWRWQLATAAPLLSRSLESLVICCCCCSRWWREGSVTSVTTKIFGLVILKRGVVPKIHPSMPGLNCPSWRRATTHSARWCTRPSCRQFLDYRLGALLLIVFMLQCLAKKLVFLAIPYVNEVTLRG